MIPVFEQMKKEAREEGREEGRVIGRTIVREEMIAQFRSVLEKDHPDWSEQRIQEECDHFFP